MGGAHFAVERLPQLQGCQDARILEPIAVLLEGGRAQGYHVGKQLGLQLGRIPGDDWLGKWRSSLQILIQDRCR